jgi:hypothetical protein
MVETTGRPGRIRFINNTGFRIDPDDLGLPKNITYVKDPNERNTYWIPGRQIDPISSREDIDDIYKLLSDQKSSKKLDGVEIMVQYS